MSISRAPIRVVLEGIGAAEGELIRFYSPRIVEAVLKKLPLEGRANLWQEEVYFEVPIKMGAEKPTMTVEKGTIAYWPAGSALCIFFGKSQPYSRVSIVGRITKGIELFQNVKPGTKIRVELLQE